MNASDDAVRGFLADADVEKTAEYMRRGRRLAGMSDDGLRAAWVAALKLMVNDPASAAARMLHPAIWAEMNLRGLEPPWGAERELCDQWRESALEILKSMSPDEYADMEEGLAADIVEYQTKLNQPKN
jgi:hypothetical protein